MRYLRCKCGEHEAWTSMGSRSCVSCDKCGTTLAEAPDLHREPEPHKWSEPQIEGSVSAPCYFRRCQQCGRREAIPKPTDPVT